MYVKTAKLVPFAVMGERYGAIGDMVKRSSQFHSDVRELQPAPLADGKFKLAPVETVLTSMLEHSLGKMRGNQTFGETFRGKTDLW